MPEAKLPLTLLASSSISNLLALMAPYIPQILLTSPFFYHINSIIK